MSGKEFDRSSKRKRDRARQSFHESLARVRQDKDALGFAGRVTRRAGEGVAGLADDAHGIVRRHYGKLATAGLLLAGWLAREQLRDMAKRYMPEEVMGKLDIDRLVRGEEEQTDGSNFHGQ